jgi:transposase
MARYKSYDYSQRVLVPVSLEDQLTPGTLEFAIHTLVESRMDLSVFDEKYRNDETGRLAYDPKVLLKVVLLAYSRGMISSRRIERTCRENVTFMALSCGQYPDHSTIAAFVSSMKDEILYLFRDVLLVCDETGLLGGTFFALDGCKLPSNASKEWSGTISDLKKKRKKIEDKVKELLGQQIQVDKDDNDDITQGGLSEERTREKQIERLQRKADRISKWLKDNDAKIGRSGKEIKSNVTDNESAKMMTSHGTIQGYNDQALIDSKHQVIVHGEAFGSGQDHGHLAPMLDGSKENLKKIGYKRDCFSGQILTADTNYHCTSNLEKCDEEGLDAYIPDTRFRKRDSRFATQKRHRLKQAERFLPEEFQYKASEDQYICPRGKTLTLRVKSIVNQGVIYKQYVSDESDCKGCSVKSKCISTSGSRRRYLTIPVGAEPSNLSWKMAEKVDSEKGRKIYPKRLAIAEPVFANIRAQKGLDRFTLRGKIKVNIQWLLYCIVHNMEKIANYGFA